MAGAKSVRLLPLIINVEGVIIYLKGWKIFPFRLPGDYLEETDFYPVNLVVRFSFQWPVYIPAHPKSLLYGPLII